MKLILLLADWAEVLSGKLYVMGGGWTEVGPAPTPSPLAAIIEVPWDETNRVHKLKFVLEDGDGQPVMVPSATGHQPLEISADFEVGRPPGSKPGTSFNVPFAVNIGPVPLHPGHTFVWRGFVDDQTHETWATAFRTRPAQPRPT